MRKGIEMYIEVIFLVLMLALSASFTFTAVNSISGKTARIANDKVMGASGQLRLTSEQLAMTPVSGLAVTVDDRMQYKVRDLMLGVINFDYGYPIEKITVSTTSGGSCEIVPKETDVLSDPRPTMAKIAKLRGGMDAAQFYEKLLKIRLQRDKDSDKIYCNILINMGS